MIQSQKLSRKILRDLSERDKKNLLKVLEVAYVEGALNFVDQLVEDKIADPGPVYSALRNRLKVLLDNKF